MDRRFSHNGFLFVFQRGFAIIKDSESAFYLAFFIETRIDLGVGSRCKIKSKMKKKAWSLTNEYNGCLGFIVLRLLF